MSTPRDVPALVHALAAVPEPRLTWYGRDGDRVELSGRVLVNWVAKTANLLLDDLDLQPGETVAVDLGAHWRAPVLWLAAAYLGAHVVSGSADADVLVLPDGVAAPPELDRLVVVALPSLARSATTLPAGAVDYAADVPTHGDAPPAPGPSASPAWLEEDLVPGRRLLGPGARAAQLLGTWAAGGSVVWHDGLDEAALEHVVAQERVDA